MLEWEAQAQLPITKIEVEKKMALSRSKYAVFLDNTVRKVLSKEIQYQWQPIKQLIEIFCKAPLSSQKAEAWGQLIAPLAPEVVGYLMGICDMSQIEANGFALAVLKDTHDDFKRSRHAQTNAKRNETGFAFFKWLFSSIVQRSFPRSIIAETEPKLEALDLFRRSPSPQYFGPAVKQALIVLDNHFWFTTYCLNKAFNQDRYRLMKVTYILRSQVNFFNVKDRKFETLTFRRIGEILGTTRNPVSFQQAYELHRRTREILDEILNI